MTEQGTRDQGGNWGRTDAGVRAIVRHRVAVAAVAVSLLVSGCASSEPTSTSTRTASPVTDKYEQTWTKTYSETTCQEWNTAMTNRQQWAAAADMLTGARNKGDGGQGVPSDELITTFQGGITTACVIPSMNIAETAVGVYLTERARFQP